MQCACLRSQNASTLLLSTAAYAVCLFVPLPRQIASAWYGRLCNVPVCALRMLVLQYLVRSLMQCACLCSQNVGTLVLRRTAYAMCLFVLSEHQYAITQYGSLCSVSVCALRMQVCQYMYLVQPLMQCVCLTPLRQYLVRTLMFLCALITLVLSTAAYAVCLFVPHYVRTLVLSTCTDTYAVCLFVPHYASTLVVSTDTYAVCLFVPHYVSILLLSMAPYAVCLFAPSLRQYSSTWYRRLCSVSVLCLTCTDYISTLAISKGVYAVFLFVPSLRQYATTQCSRLCSVSVCPLGMEMHPNTKHMKVRNVSAQLTITDNQPKKLVWRNHFAQLMHHPTNKSVSAIITGTKEKIGKRSPILGMV